MAYVCQCHRCGVCFETPEDCEEHAVDCKGRTQAQPEPPYWLTGGERAAWLAGYKAARGQDVAPRRPVAPPPPVPPRIGPRPGGY